MKLSELTEGRVKNAAIDAEYDKQNTPYSLPIKKPQGDYYVTINSKPWKKAGEIVSFPDEQQALNAANSIHRSRPRLSVSVFPFKK